MTADDGYPGEGTVSLTDRLEHRRALSTVGRTVGGVFNIATGIDGAIVACERGTDLKTGIGAIGTRTRGYCLFYECASHRQGQLSSLVQPWRYVPRRRTDGVCKECFAYSPQHEPIR